MKKFTAASYEEFCQKFTLEVPENYNFAFDVLDAMAEETPDKLCIRHVSDDFSVRDQSFREVADASSQVAAALAAKGIGKGDRVMLILYRRLEWWHVLLGLHKLGAVAIPAPAQLTVKDIVFRCNKAKTKAVIVDYTVTDRVEAARADCPDLDLCVQVGPAPMPKGWTDYGTMLAEAPARFPRPAEADKLACGKDPMLIFFSSGTTGMPKMVLHTHEYPLGHLFTGMYWHDLEETDIHLTVADTGWGKAVWGKSYGQWMAGAAVFIYDYRGKFTPSALLKVIADNGVTTFCAPPTIYRFLVREDLTQYDLSKLRHCTTAGELLNESVFHAWKAVTGLTIYEGFGQTETTLQLATLPCMEAKAGSIGKPVPGWDVRVINEQDEVCAPGDEGEICVRLSHDVPCSLFVEYLDEPELTAKAMHDGWYHTGDKAWVDEEGYFWFLGRVDDLIKTSGYRVGPFEVESALVSHDAVVEAAVTGVPDPVRGQVVKATVVLRPGLAPSDALTKELQEHVKTVTAPYKYPRVVEYVAELPKTISGKIKRAEIRSRDESMRDDGEKSSAAAGLVAQA
ncbi:Acyl-coenzyme A synthetase ACSM3, mitochondrial [uncultured delta proteobacterium]|uniref:Acyl-coenzyme A synthetase ACSM3, mitochondrial n=1 Tax=uncultured delta proteobacterium TaxID=34034 RepID=A0A212IZ93_9DELT|nr:Acyl-coenzyme A synthetase ACSM3, mitochondrial [uncultured delta proteobacterium]